MTVSIVGYNSNVLVSGDGLGRMAVTLPSSLQPNDLVLICFTNWTPMITPTGWTLVGVQTGGRMYYMFKKDTVSSADSGTTVLISLVDPLTATYEVYTSIAFRSTWGPIDIINSTGSGQQNSNTYVSCSPVTATYESELVVAMYGFQSNSYYPFNNTTSLTLINDPNDRYPYSMVLYQVLAQGQSTTAGSIGFAGALSSTSDGAGVVLARFNLATFRPVLTDTIQTQDALSAGWHLSYAAADALNITEQALMGKQYPNTLTDAFSLADATGAIYAAFSLVNLSDTINIGDTNAAVTGYPVYDTVKSRDIFTNFAAITPLYTDAASAFAAWCASAGVSKLGTDVAFAGLYYEFLEVDVGFTPISYDTSTSVFIGGSGNFALFPTAPGNGASGHPNGQANYPSNNAGWANYVMWPYDNPVFVFGLVDNVSAYVNMPTFQIKLGSNYPTIRDEALIYAVMYSQISGQPDQIGIAIRLRPGYIEIVASPVALYMGHAHSLVYQVEDYRTSSLTTANILATDWTSGNVYHFMSDDKSNLITTIRDAIGIAGPANPQVPFARFQNSGADIVRILETTSPSVGITLQQGMGISDVDSWDIRYSALIADTLKILDAQVLKGTYATTLAENALLTDAIMRTYPVAQADSIALQDVTQTLLGIRVLEQLNFLDSALPKATIYQTVAELLKANDVLRQFLSGVAIDTIAVADSVTFKYNILQQISETVAILPDLATYLMLRADVTDNISLSSDQILQMIFSGALAEGVQVSAAYVNPGNTTTAWAVNTRTGATTEYQNYEFNSFASSGHHYLGASANGLYVLDGADDDGVPTIAHLRSGYAQFNGSRFTAFKAAYIGVRAGTGDFYFKLDAGDGTTYTYRIVAQNMQTTKVQLGKGLRARYFAFELISTGQDFDLDTIEFVPMTAQRRI